MRPIRPDTAFARALEAEVARAELEIQAEYLRQLNEWCDNWQPNLTGLTGLVSEEGIAGELGE